MSGSRMVRYQWRCSGCGADCGQAVWVLICAEERAGVLLAGGPALTDVTCGSCGTAEDIDLPVVVVRPEHLCQLLFAFPDSYRGPAIWPGVPDLLNEALVAHPGRLSGWSLPIPRVLLAVALSRDVLADVRRIDAACAEVADQVGTVRGARYRRFLELVVEGEPDRVAAKALQELWAVGADQLAGFLACHPELGSDAALRAVRARLESGPPPGEPDGPLRARVALVESLRRGEPPEDVARRYLADVGALGAMLQQRMGRLLAEITSMPPGDTSPTVIEWLREAADLARDVGETDLEATLCADLIGRLVEIDDSRLVEEVIGRGTRALSLGVADRDLRVSLLTNLSIAYRARSEGDQTENWDTAHALLTEAADLVDRATDPRSWALIRTNLAFLVQERPGRTADDLRAALALVREGLEERSPERNIVDWAFSQLHLGLINQRLAEELARGDGHIPAADLDLSRTAYEDALRHLLPADHRLLWFTLVNNLADVLLLTEPPDARRARDIVETAAAQVGEDEATTVRARLEWLRARIADIEEGPDSDRALAHREHVLDLLDRNPDPHMFLRVAGQLAEAYARLARWDAAADVYERAATVERALYTNQIYTESRSTSASSRAARWAAYCLTRAGRPQRAVELLEEGCARRLSESVGRSTADLDRLAAADPALAADWAAANDRLRHLFDTANSGLIGADTTDAVRAEAAIRQLTAQIRRIPGFEAFLQPLTCADIAAVSGGPPIVYLVNAPAGTVVLGVCQLPTGPAVEAAEVPEITSMDVLRLAIIDDTRPTLLMAQAGDGDNQQRELPRALRRLAELRPLAAGLESVLARFRTAGAPADTAVVVPTGLLGLVPLHALPAADEPFLDDTIEIRLTPSAAVYAASRRRASQQHPPALLAIADTLDSAPLPGAACEADHARQIFRDQAQVLTGPNATRQRVISAARGRTHLHFACHGTSQLGDPRGGSLRLADGRLTIDDLLDGRLNRCRLVVASACQSGHYAPTEDFTGLAAGFLHAGAAAAIVTLWPIGDIPTALLISYLYDQIAATDTAHHQDPPTALRTARRWLRNLTLGQARNYLTTRPSLTPLLTRLPAASPDDDTLFAAPRLWAPFSCHGC